jgi:glycine dehydrogenase subunit 1
VLMAERITRRRRVLVARSVHPEYRQVLDTYARNLDMSFEEIGYTASGQIDLQALAASINNETAAVLVQSPNFFGVLEPVPQIAEIARGAEALAVVAIAEGVCLGAVRPPAEADIVALETQSFGMAPSFGGPYAGVIAAREKYIRQLPGRLAGQTTDSQGRRGFCLTLATREQHIRRERATSNICTNQALCALAATVHLCLLGKQGLQELAAQNIAKAQFALAELEKVPGVRRVFRGPVFNEFAVQFPRAVRLINAQLLRDKIIGPLPLGPYYPELAKCGLVCVTETTTREEIERLACAVRDTLAVPV